MNNRDNRQQGSVVFVVDDDEAMRSSLQWLIEAEGHPVETFNSAADFLARHDPERVGCLLLDVRMPGMSGLELQAQLEQREIRIPVIIITGHGDVAMAVRAMKAGAFDFIEKPFDDKLLLDTIGRALQQEAAQREGRAVRTEVVARLASLTRRELEVMERVTDGKSNKQIAAELNVSSKTVEAHRARVMEKMEASSLAQLVRMALLANTDNS